MFCILNITCNAIYISCWSLYKRRWYFDGCWCKMQGKARKDKKRRCCNCSLYLYLQFAALYLYLQLHFCSSLYLYLYLYLQKQFCSSLYLYLYWPSYRQGKKSTLDMNPFHLCWFVAIKDLSLPLLHLLRILKKDWRPRSAFLLLLLLFTSFLFTSGSVNTSDGVFPFATTNNIGPMCFNSNILEWKSLSLRSWICFSDLSQTQKSANLQIRSMSGCDGESLYEHPLTILQAPSSTLQLPGKPFAWRTASPSDKLECSGLNNCFYSNLFFDLWKSDRLGEIEMDT